MIHMLTKTLKHKKKALPLTLAGLMFLTVSMTGVAYGTEDQHNNSRKQYTSNDNPNNKNRSSNINYDEQVKQYVKLRGLLQEHAALAGMLTTYRYDNNPQFDAAKMASLKNGELIADLVGQKYGGDARSEFLDQWNRHLHLYIQYTDSLKTNDTALRDQTVQELIDFTEKTSDLLAGSGDFPKNDVRNDLRTHVSLAAAVVDAHARGDYNAQFTKMHEAHEHAGMMADRLAQAQR